MAKGKTATIGGSENPPSGDRGIEGEAIGSPGHEKSGSEDSGLGGQVGEGDGGLRERDGGNSEVARAPEKDGGSAPAKKRGRPALTDAERSARAAAKASAISENGRVSVIAAKDIIDAIAGLHEMAAQFFPDPVKPIVRLQPQEAQLVGSALYKVGVEFDLLKYVTGGGKGMAVAGLAIAVIIVYKPRVTALKAISAEMRKAAPNPNHVDVSSLQPEGVKPNE